MRASDDGSGGMIDLRVQRYGLIALLSAALFGVSTPLAKLLLEGIGALTLAGLLYLGAGAGLFAIRAVRGRTAEARLQAGDLPWLASAVAAGGILAPILLMWGLGGTSASSASLLLSFEGVITAMIAAAAFGEAVGRRVWAGSLVMLAGGLLLAYDPASAFGLSLHSLAIVGACVLWGVDNNLTRRISAADAGSIAMIKGLTGGTVNLALGWVSGEPLPGAMAAAGAMALGLASYGLSLVLYIRALRHLGAARAAAHFGTAPFFGALVAIVLLGEPLTLAFMMAVAFIAVASWLVLSERHAHEHVHELLVHSHVHTHDDHHAHAHPGQEGSEPHAHDHVHDRLRHSHPHLPDIHHRHDH